MTDEKLKAYQDIELEMNEFKKAARDRELKIKREWYLKRGYGSGRKYKPDRSL